MFGLSVSYELYDEAALLARSEQKNKSDLLKTATDLSALLPPSRYDNAPSVSTKRHVRAVEAENKDLQLKELSYLNCMINKTAVRKFVMKNNSGIKAPFTLKSQNYEALRYLDQMQPAPAEPDPMGSSRATPTSKRSIMEVSERSNFVGLTRIYRFIVEKQQGGEVFDDNEEPQLGGEEEEGLRPQASAAY